MVMEKYPAIRYQLDGIQQYMDHVIREERFRLYLNNEPLAVQIASPEQLKELGAGFVVTEGIAKEVNSVSVTGDEIWIEAEIEDEEREIEWRTCGGSGIRKVPQIVSSSLQIDPSEVFRVTDKIESETWRMTGGVHCSVLFSDGELIAKSCDIGRHNTVDKVVGHAVLSGVDRSRCYIGCTGRQPAGMVSKSANAKIPIIISRAASTDRGILTARDAGVTLICFSRQKRFTVYTHPERIKGLEQYTEKGEE
ncbi:MAG: formate dehydrogenase accessory sulfurtransferase FdhD [Methanomicrobiaceae archaeon]|nr:formate dehydrogenase accessory sulfurtransferase FdhD [Methanomicrobiaceae archaeon]